MKRLTTWMSAVFLLALSKLAMSAGTVWFEVSAVDESAEQSYLLPLQQPEDIAAARAQIELRDGGDAGALVVAKIRPGGDGINRNLRSEDHRLWSWHVEGFEEFGDVAIELCDGSPGLVEQDPEWFAENTGDLICFWGYSVARELPGKPEFAVREELDGFWHAAGASGTGFSVDILEKQGLLALAWMRFAPTAGAIPEQQWLVGVGAISTQQPGDPAIEVELVQTGPLSDGEIPATPITTVSIQFIDCNHAWLTILDDVAQTMELNRTVPKFDCNPEEVQLPAGTEGLGDESLQRFSDDGTRNPVASSSTPRLMGVFGRAGVHLPALDDGFMPRRMLPGTNSWKGMRY